MSQQPQIVADLFKHEVGGLGVVGAIVKYRLATNLIHGQPGR